MERDKNQNTRYKYRRKTKHHSAAPAGVRHPVMSEGYFHVSPYGYFDELMYDGGILLPEVVTFMTKGQITKKSVYTVNMTATVDMQYDDTDTANVT